MSASGGPTTDAVDLSIRCHLAPRHTRVHELNGVRVSTPAQLFVELARYLALVDLVVLGDAIVRRRLSSVSKLKQAAMQCSRASNAARYVRRDVDSPMETRLRMLLVLAGLPEPRVNVRLRDRNGEVVAQFDLCYPEIRLIVQYDGRHHADDDKQWQDDIHRREQLDEHNWRVLIVTARGIFREPDRTLSRVHRALRSCRFPGAPRELNPAWRAHFPMQVG
jgi:very-short-patch-repair endonuclease